MLGEKTCDVRPPWMHDAETHRHRRRAVERRKHYSLVCAHRCCQPAVLIELGGGTGSHGIDVDLAHHSADVADRDHLDRAARLDAGDDPTCADATPCDDGVDVAPDRAGRYRGRRRLMGSGNGTHERVGVRLGESATGELCAVTAYVVEE